MAFRVTLFWFARNAETRRFLLDAFEDDVRGIIENIIENEDVDTDMVDRQKLFRMVVDIAKKRESYVPRKKKSKSTSKVVDLTLSVNKVAAKVAAASSDVKVEKDDNDPKDDETLDDELVNLDKNEQDMRSKMKDKYADPKNTPPKKTKTKKKQTKKTKPKKKQTKKNQKATNERGEVLKPGMKVQGKWKGDENYGEWFDGVVVSVNNKKKTCHIRYDDGDKDDAVSFHDVSII